MSFQFIGKDQSSQNHPKNSVSSSSFGAISSQSGSHFSNGTSHICCLVDSGKSCTRPASNASYSKKIQGTVAQRKLRLDVDPKSSHMYICDHHKIMIQSVRSAKRKRLDSEESSETNTSSTNNNSREYIDLFQLQMNTLRRYKKHYKVTSRPGLNKAQLAEFLTRHLKTIPVVEKEALTYFIYMIKTKKSRLEHVTENDQTQND